MKSFSTLILSILFTSMCLAADVKISQLPLGTAATTGVNDSFPYVAAATSITKRLTIWDLINIPTLVATYAPKASPTFTGVVTAPSFVGALTGNATTATALAANPTDCSSNQYANAIAANGNLTCSAVTTSQLSGTVGVAQGGTGITSGTSGGVLAFTATGTIASSGALAASQLVLGGGAGVAPSSLAPGSQYQVLVMGASNPGYGQVNLAQGAAITGTLPTGNGGTGQASALTQYGVIYSSSTSAMGSTAAGSTGQYLGATTSSAPTFKSFTAPKVTVYTTGSGTHTFTGSPLYVQVIGVGAGGGGAGSGTSPGAAGAGGNTTFGTTFLVANGGAAGSGQNGGSGGTASLGTADGTATSGSDGVSVGAVVAEAGGPGGTSLSGGSGSGGVLNASGLGGKTNSGSGGGGGGGSGSVSGAGGGASGGSFNAYISGSILSGLGGSVSYAVGGAGSLGTAGTGGFAGGPGGSGKIIVIEHYQ